MNNCRVAVLVGSLRQDSYNRRLARAVEKLAPEKLEFVHVRIDDLPLYTQDFDADYPANAQRLKREIESAQALLFVTPEYNRSVPGVLKNAIDIASRPWGTNSFAGKPAAVIGTSIGVIGTAVAQHHLRSSLAYLDVPTLGQPEVYLHFRNDVIAPDGAISDGSTKKFLQGFVDAYVKWVERFVR
ncbi:MAG: NAD(P)H-dependent oxidoreductase [Burkholderiaceae bacterium]|nr:NAD(P)H-dependent oxidoreductase [Burkholderiaceae bacterium]